MLRAMIENPNPVLLSTTLQPLRPPPQLAAGLQRSAEVYRRLASVRRQPAGLYSASRELPANWLARDAETPCADAARRYRDAA